MKTEEEIRKALEASEICVITGDKKQCCVLEVIKTLEWILE